MPATADELLYTDLDGVFVGLDDVIADGLDRDYAGRLAELRELLVCGTPVHRLHACIVLASWGVRDGLLTVIEWAREPQWVPWGDGPASVDRMFGADDSFARLAAALSTAGDVDLTPVGARLRVAATRTLLLLYDRFYFDRSMFLLLDLDRQLAAATQPEIEWAVERATAAAPSERRFDMATQAALLLGSLAELDDLQAAMFATELIRIAPDWPRTLREVAYGLGYGSGAQTLGVLERLAASRHTEVAHEAQEWLRRRAGHD